MKRFHWCRLGLAGLGLFGLMSGPARASCGQSYCVINTNWYMQGIPADAGSSRIDLRYEGITQNQLMQGSQKLSADEATGHHVERRTVNRNLLATYEYTASNNWGFGVVLPVVYRDHEHDHHHHGQLLQESWQFTRVGDMRAVANYSLALDDDPVNRVGIQFGAKLPSGSFTQTNSQGKTAERSLQPGSGTTDLLLTAFFTHRGMTAGAAWFAQAGVQQASYYRDGYKPGTQTALTTGYNQPLVGALTGTVQFNALWKSRDSGVEAEPDLSGGRGFFISPGLSYAATKAVQLYTYAQLPVYRYVNGTQLVASWGFVAGAAVQF